MREPNCVCGDSTRICHHYSTFDDGDIKPRGFVAWCGEQCLKRLEQLRETWKVTVKNHPEIAMEVHAVCVGVSERFMKLAEEIWDSRTKDMEENE